MNIYEITCKSPIQCELDRKKAEYLQSGSKIMRPIRYIKWMLTKNGTNHERAERMATRLFRSAIKKMQEKPSSNTAVKELYDAYVKRIALFTGAKNDLKQLVELVYQKKSGFLDLDAVTRCQLLCDLKQLPSVKEQSAPERSDYRVIYDTKKQVLKDIARLQSCLMSYLKQGSEEDTEKYITIFDQLNKLTYTLGESEENGFRSVETHCLDSLFNENTFLSDLKDIKLNKIGLKVVFGIQFLVALSREQGIKL